MKKLIAPPPLSRTAHLNQGSQTRHLPQLPLDQKSAHTTIILNKTGRRRLPTPFTQLSERPLHLSEDHPLYDAIKDLMPRNPKLERDTFYLKYTPLAVHGAAFIFRHGFNTVRLSETNKDGTHLSAPQVEGGIELTLEDMVELDDLSQLLKSRHSQLHPGEATFSLLENVTFTMEEASTESLHDVFDKGFKRITINFQGRIDEYTRFITPNGDKILCAKLLFTNESPDSYNMIDPNHYRACSVRSVKIIHPALVPLETFRELAGAGVQRYEYVSDSGVNPYRVLKMTRINVHQKSVNFFDTRSHGIIRTNLYQRGRFVNTQPDHYLKDIMDALKDVHASL